MADVEALGDVDGGIVDAHRLARALAAAAVGSALRQGRLHHLPGVQRPVDVEIQVALYRLHPGQKGTVHGRLQLLGDEGRGLA